MVNWRSSLRFNNYKNNNFAAIYISSFAKNV